MSKKRSTQPTESDQVVMATLIDQTVQNKVVMGTLIDQPAQYQVVQNSPILPDSVHAFMCAVQQAQNTQNTHDMHDIQDIQVSQMSQSTQIILSDDQLQALISENKVLNKQLSDLFNLYKQEIKASAIAHNLLIMANMNRNHQLFIENFNIMKRIAHSIPDILAHAEYYMNRIIIVRAIINNNQQIKQSQLIQQTQPTQPIQPTQPTQPTHSEIFDGLSIISNLNPLIFGKPSDI